MSQPLTFSIVINNYNYGRFVGDAIDSALGQTHRAVEVIVVDDGSTDDSRRIIESRGCRVRTIFKTNGGQASALNAGFAASTGDLILFLDSDNILLPAAAETVVREWREGVAHARFPLELIDATGRPLGRLIEDAVLVSPRRWPFSPGSPMSGNVFSRKALEKVMPIPEEDWKICADVTLTAASALFGDMTRISEPLGKYRLHGDNHYAGAGRDLSGARRLVSNTFRLYNLLRTKASTDIGPFDEWVGSYPQYWVGRIVSLRASPGDHPWPDSLPKLIRKALRATWRHPYWNLRRKLAYTTFVFCYGVLPSKIARGLRVIEGRAQIPLVRRVLGGSRPLG